MDPLNMELCKLIVVFQSFFFEIILTLDFRTVAKILIWFSLIKRFPNDYKRYSGRLPVLILQRVAPIKVY